MAVLQHPNLADVPLTTVLHALGDPVRLGLVMQLACTSVGKEGKTCTEVWCGTLPRSTLTHHLNILRQAGLVFTTKHGTARHNHLRIDDMNARFPGLLETIGKLALKECPETMAKCKEQEKSAK